MSATPSSFTPFYPEGNGTAIPPGATVPLQASAQIGYGQIATFDASGNAALNDGTVGYVIAAGVGYSAKLSDTNTTAGVAKNAQWWGFGGMPNATTGGDGVVAADIGGVPLFGADAQTVGKLAVSGGNDRSFFGLGFGLNADGLVRCFGGPIGQLLARLLHAANAESAGNLAYAVDGSASTDIASSANPYMIPRAARRGKILSIEIIPSASLSATSGNDAILTIVKVDTTGGVALASSPTVGTFTTTTALVAGQPTKFTLSGTAANLLLRTTDILAFYRTHNGTGAVIPQSAIRANFQVV